MRLNSIGPLFLKSCLVPLAFTVLLAAPRPAPAQSDGGALVLHGCPDTFTVVGHSYGIAYQVCADIVFTPSGDVNASLHGALLDPATAPTQTVVVRDFPCVYGNQSTNDSQIVITPDGNVNGYCRLHND